MGPGVQVTRRDRPEFAVLELRGAVTGAADQPLLDAYRSASTSPANGGDVLLLFAQVEHLDSAGIAILIEMLTEARQAGRRVLVAGLSSHYRKIFDLMGLPQFAPVFDTEDDARRWAQEQAR